MTKYTFRAIVSEDGWADGATETIGAGDGSAAADGGAEAIGLPAGVATGWLPAPTLHAEMDAIRPSTVARMSQNLEVEPFIVVPLACAPSVAGGWARPVTARSLLCNNVVTGWISALAATVDGITY